MKMEINRKSNKNPNPNLSLNRSSKRKTMRTKTESSLPKTTSISPAKKKGTKWALSFYRKPEGEGKRSRLLATSPQHSWTKAKGTRPFQHNRPNKAR